MPKPKLLVIDDEKDLRDLLEYHFQRAGFQFLGAAEGEAGLKLARESRPDLIVLDLMLPGVDGIGVCRALRSTPDTREIPIVMLTAKGEEADIVLGLSVGADDYLTKPFSPAELVARIRAVLRRGPLKDGADGRIRVGELLIDSVAHTVYWKDEPVPVTLTQLRLLRYLAANPARVFTRNQLLDHASGPDAFIIDRNIDVHIRALRKKIPALQDLVQTVRGVGYRFGG
jgi:DNA-binding response OmpR family regulator